MKRDCVSTLEHIWPIHDDPIGDSQRNHWSYAAVGHLTCSTLRFRDVN